MTSTISPSTNSTLSTKSVQLFFFILSEQLVIHCCVTADFTFCFWKALIEIVISIHQWEMSRQEQRHVCIINNICIIKHVLLFNERKWKSYWPIIGSCFSALLANFSWKKRVTIYSETRKSYFSKNRIFFFYMNKSCTQFDYLHSCGDRIQNTL